MPKVVKEPKEICTIHIEKNADDFLPDFDPSRIYQPYEVFHLLKDRYTEEDIGSELDEVLENGDYDIPDEVLQKLPKKLVGRFNKALSMNDTYWDCFWMQIRSVIEDAIKEYKMESWKDAKETMPPEFTEKE